VCTCTVHRRGGQPDELLVPHLRGYWDRSQVLIKQMFCLVSGFLFLFIHLQQVSLSYQSFRNTSFKTPFTITITCARKIPEYNFFFFTQFACRTRVTRQTHASRKPPCPWYTLHGTYTVLHTHTHIYIYTYILIAPHSICSILEKIDSELLNKNSKETKCSLVERHQRLEGAAPSRRWCPSLT
jgi:hypothetical protein